MRNPRQRDARRQANMSVDWSQLPPELLEIIAKKLNIYIDYLRFGAVCRKWRASVPNTPNHLPCQLPWLMLPQSRSYRAHRNRRAFFSLSENKFHFLNLPGLSRRQRLCGSSHGWLVILDETPTIFLINALTNAKIYLPPLSTLPNVIGFNFANIGREYSLRSSSGDLYTRSLREMRDSFIKKVVLSASPSNDGDFIALAILNETGDLAFCREGDQSWSLIDEAQTYCEDVIYFEGLFYAVNIDGMLAVCNVSESLPIVTKIWPPRHVGKDMHYLVNWEDELLLVTRHLYVEYDVEQLDIIYKTSKFKVFMLDSIEMSWERVKTLGDWALFLGQNSSLCLSGSDFPGCKRNCIYFTDDYSECNDEVVLGDHDIGIFNLGDGSVEHLPCYPQNSHSRLDRPPPIWVTPNPC